jgi:hypothetical protein
MSQKKAPCVKFSMKKLDGLAHLLANPVLPKASCLWSEADVVIASAAQPDHLRRSFYPRGREVLTEHALEVSYFFEVLRDPFYEEVLMDHCSKIEFLTDGPLMKTLPESVSLLVTQTIGR